MDKYIKLDTTKKTLRDFIYECDASGMNPDLIRGITYTMEWLDRIPLEDVAPVVRCKNCRYHDEGEGYIYCWALKTKCPNNSEFFCKYGELEG